MNRSVATRAGVLAGAATVVGGVVGLLLQTSQPGLVLALLLGLALAGTAAGYVAFRTVAGAIAEVGAAARSVAGGNLEQRVYARSPAVEGLAHEFNTMASRLQASVSASAAEHARLEAAFEASADAMVAVASDTSVRLLNAAAARVFGEARDRVLGRPLIESVRDYELDSLVRAAIASRKPGVAVITFGRARTPLRVSALPISGGGDWAVLLMLTDLTEVQRVDQVRRDFVSNVSHELRTPLASLKAVVETMQDAPAETPEEQELFLGHLHRQVDRLIALVNELLDLSRIESGALALSPEVLEVSAAIAEAVAVLRPRSQAAGVALELPGTTLTIEADGPSLVRIITNLVDNALKFSPRGGTVRVLAEERDGSVEIAVADEGPGIQPQDRERVFERFFKAEHSRSDSGTGLGLAIVKHLVRAHGGSVGVESVPGEGAKFAVRLPVRFAGDSAALPMRPRQAAAPERPGSV